MALRPAARRSGGLKPALPAWGLLLIGSDPVLAEPTGAGLPINGLQWLAGLAVVILAIVMLGMLLRRLHPFSRIEPGAFQILAALSVGTRERVVLVRVGDKQLVVGVAPGRVQTLCELTGADRVEPLAANQEPSFAARLAALRAGKPS
jgi:flagellar protein FliO/FliZ